MQWVLAVMTGLALSAACGFRVFVPPLVIAIAAKAGYLTLSPGFAWMGSDMALAIFAGATVLEIGAYYIPWLDHALDVLAMPAAIVAGTVISASFITGMDPMLAWVLAAIAGGGAAATVQTVTTGVRMVSTAATGGLGNPIVSSVEAALAMYLSMIAVFLPAMALAAVVIAALLVVLFLTRRRRRTVNQVAVEPSAT